MNITPRFVIEDDDLDLLWQFTAWIKDVAGYARLEYLRKLKYRKLERPLEDIPQEMLSYEDPMPAGKEDFDFAEEKLSRAFTGLNLLRRRILTLTFVEGLTAQETADKLGCSVEYVYE